MTFQFNAYAQEVNMEFITFLGNFKSINGSVGSYEMRQNAGNYIDNDLA